MTRFNVYSGARRLPCAARTAAASRSILGVLAGMVLFGFTSTATAATPLDPLTLTKFVDPLPIPGPMPQAALNYYEIGAWPIQQKLHSQLPPTNLYGYGPTQETASYPAATIEVVRGTPIHVHWTDHLPLPHLLSYAIDSTLMQAMTTTGVPIVPHVHGGETEPQSDGTPMEWFTPGFAEKGPAWQKEVFEYANRQQAATIWYHDHAFGYTRLNVYCGLAGFYIIRDPGREPVGLPSGKYEIPIVIQDRMFNTDGSLLYPSEGDNPEHPIWVPEFFGNTIVVNGKIWPYLNVEPRKYRFRFLDGSQARFYNLALTAHVKAPSGGGHISPDGPVPGGVIPMVQIGTDGGYLAAPVEVGGGKATPLIIAPGERADVVVDFTGQAVGTQILLKNTAKAPYPTGDAPDAKTVGQIMLFKVVASTGPDDSTVPTSLNSIPSLGSPVQTRPLVLYEVEGQDGPLGMFLNGRRYLDPVTETPTLGTTEEWDIINTTADTHPIHMHLVQFQLLNRQKFNLRAYKEAFDAANPVIPADDITTIPVGPYLLGSTAPPDPNEAGWKDTFRMNPGEVTRVRVRFAPQDDTYGSSFAFDATAAPGYVWHCHILEHEENDMMRPLQLMAPVAGSSAAEDASLATPLASAAMPGAATLRTALPNPARGGMMVRFALPAASNVELKIYDVLGHQVRVLAATTFAAGEHQVQWSGDDDGGRTVGPGMYFCRMNAAGRMATQKLLLLP